MHSIKWQDGFFGVFQAFHRKMVPPLKFIAPSFRIQKWKITIVYVHLRKTSQRVNSNAHLQCFRKTIPSTFCFCLFHVPSVQFSQVLHFMFSLTSLVRALVTRAVDPKLIRAAAAMLLIICRKSVSWHKMMSLCWGRLMCFWNLVILSLLCI